MAALPRNKLKKHFIENSLSFIYDETSNFAAYFSGKTHCRAFN